jgi:hypothetical protein
MEAADELRGGRGIAHMYRGSQARRFFDGRLLVDFLVIASGRREQQRRKHNEPRP